MPVIRICRNCGREIKAYGPQILCSDKCRKEDRNKQERLRYASDAEYCKDKTARATKPIKQPRIIRCEWCGKPLETKPRRKNCNKACQDEYWTTRGGAILKSRTRSLHAIRLLMKKESQHLKDETN